ncbi:hypothetical protein TNCV_53951 [Trichonephila clavipes]|nr:hypothetical protein TNCV_53951 [Trichonephila clavipes]
MTVRQPDGVNLHQKRGKQVFQLYASSNQWKSFLIRILQAVWITLFDMLRAYAKILCGECTVQSLRTIVKVLSFGQQFYVFTLERTWMILVEVRSNFLYFIVHIENSTLLGRLRTYKSHDDISGLGEEDEGRDSALSDGPIY